MDVNETISSTAVKTIKLSHEEAQAALEARARENKFAPLRDPELDEINVNIYDDGQVTIVVTHRFPDNASAE